MIGHSKWKRFAERTLDKQVKASDVPYEDGVGSVEDDNILFAAGYFVAVKAAERTICAKYAVTLNVVDAISPQSWISLVAHHDSLTTNAAWQHEHHPLVVAASWIALIGLF